MKTLILPETPTFVDLTGVVELDHVSLLPGKNEHNPENEWLDP